MYFTDHELPGDRQHVVRTLGATAPRAPMLRLYPDPFGDDDFEEAELVEPTHRCFDCGRPLGWSLECGNMNCESQR